MKRAAALPLADAALLGCLLTALCFQSLRIEVFEAEKLGLQVLFASVIGGSVLIHYSRPQQFRPHLLTLAVGGVLGAGAVTTILALSPAISLAGSLERSQGWLSVLVGALLFEQARRMSDQTVSLIFPTLCLTAILMCLPAIVQYYQLDPALLQALALGSTAGNINFLAAWIAPTLLYIVPGTYQQVRRNPSGRSGWLLLGSVSILLMGFVLILTNSRAAFIGLGAALITIFWLWCALHRRKQLALAALLIGGFLVVLGVFVVSLEKGFQFVSGQDEFRTRVWNQGILLVGQMTEPLYTAEGVPDQWAGLRPLVGYGLDSINQLESRFLSAIGSYNNQISVDRIHNLTLDTILMNGGLGLAAQLLLYEAALYMGLRWLRLMQSRHQLLGLLVLQLLGGVITGFVAFHFTHQSGLSFVLGTLGSLTGLWGWLVWHTFRPIGDLATIEQTNCWFVLVVLGMVIHHYVSNQFGFPQIISQTLWWFFLGWLLRQTSRIPIAPAEQPSLYRLTVVAGLYALYAFARTVSPGWTAILVGSFGLLAFGGIWLLKPLNQVRFFQWVGLALAIWILFALAVDQYRVGVATGINQLLLNLPTDASAVIGTNTLAFAVVGVVLVAVTFLILSGTNRFLHLSWRQGVMAVVALAGVTFYVSTYTGAVLHRTAKALAVINDPQAFQAADVCYETASQYASYSPNIWADRARMWQIQPGVTSLNTPIIDTFRRQALAAAPFWNHTRWYQDTWGGP